MVHDVDVAVLGGGPGGYVAAIRCAQYGLKTALIEEGELGGTCLNRGCIPTKALIQGAELAAALKEANDYGVKVEGLSLEYARLAAFKEKKVAGLRRGVELLEKQHGVEVLRGSGRLLDRYRLEVNDRTLRAKHIIIATGSRPAMIPIEGATSENVLTSDGFLALKTLPQSVVIVGGGVIGVEFASLLSALGCRVTILEMLPEILPGLDKHLREGLVKALTESGVEIHTGARLLSIQGQEGIFQQGETRQTARGEQFLICVGRKPRTEGIGLEAAGVAVDKGYVPVDDGMRTNIDNIYAVGDITGKHQLAHAASAQGMVAAANCAGRAEDVFDLHLVPSCIYTTPEVASVGLSEAEAVAKGHKVRVGSFQVSGNGRSTLMNESRGFCRIVTEEITGEILGAQIMSPRATDLIAEVAVAMRCEGTIRELATTIHPHPTVSEIVMEAAQDALGLCCHAFPKK